jgi:hypothetical protein
MESGSEENGSRKCHCGLVAPGVLWPFWPEEGIAPPAGWSWVEQRECCGLYASDARSAGALLAIGIGTEVRSFPDDRLDVRKGLSPAIDVAMGFPLGVRFKVVRSIQYALFVAPPGLTGVVTICSEGLVSMQLDEPFPDAEENVLQFVAPEAYEPSQHALSKLLQHAVAVGDTRRHA